MLDHAYDITSLREYTVKDWKAGHQAYLLPNLSPVEVYLLAQCGESNPDLIPWACTSAYDQVIRLSLLRTVPLCWVEGKAVYKGDTLYVKNNVRVEPVKVFDRKGQELVRVEWRIDGQLTKTTLYTTNLTWNKPENKEPTMQETAKDFSTLRPFTERNEKAGDISCNREGVAIATYYKQYLEDSHITGKVKYVSTFPATDSSSSDLFVNPICWIEGIAVYQGCTLYLKTNHHGEQCKEVRVIGKHDDNTLTVMYVAETFDAVCQAGIDCLSWTKSQEYKTAKEVTGTEPVNGDVRKDIETRVKFLERELGLFKSMLNILDYAEQVSSVKNNQPT